jgi:hypothetical protein
MQVESVPKKVNTNQCVEHSYKQGQLITVQYSFSRLITISCNTVA